MFSSRRNASVIVLLAALIAMIGVLWCALAADDDGSKESFLVATRQLIDPVFQHTVILRVPSPEPPLVAGVIVNKRSELKIEEVFPHDSALKGRSDKAFFGGPVDLTSPILLTRGARSSDARKIFGDIYMTSDPGSIAAVLKQSGSSDKVRLVLGRAQWSRDQLRAEIAEGSWYIVPATADTLFSSDAEELWHTLVHRAQLEEAEADFPGEAQTPVGAGGGGVESCLLLNPSAIDLLSADAALSDGCLPRMLAVMDSPSMAR